MWSVDTIQMQFLLWPIMLQHLTCADLGFLKPSVGVSTHFTIMFEICLLCSGTFTCVDLGCLKPSVGVSTPFHNHV